MSLVVVSWHPSPWSHGGQGKVGQRDEPEPRGAPEPTLLPLGFLGACVSCPGGCRSGGQDSPR